MTTFEITEKPIRTLMTVSGIEVVVGTQYDIALESATVLHNATPFLGEPFDSFKYKVTKDGKVSVNTGTVRVSFATNKTGVPPILTIVQDIHFTDSFFFSDIVAPEAHYDRITITNIEGRGSWTLNGNIVFVGQTIFYYDLVNNLKFIADNPGNMDDYAVFTWDTESILGNHGQTNTITVNTSSLNGAELVLVSGPSSEQDPTTLVETTNYSFKIQNSIVGASYQIGIDTTLYPTIGINPLDIVGITERDYPEGIINTSGLFVIDFFLDDNGETVYYVRIVKDTDTVVENSITITLNDVDGDPLNVNPLLNQLILIIPITPTP
jgi:hypothetical protein